LPAWRYWKARALKAQGKTAAANAIFAPLSGEHLFYGQLAEEELGAVIGPPSIAYKPGGDEIAAVRKLPSVQRALALYRLGLRTEATREWLWGTRNFNDRQLLAAAEVARREEWPDRSINTANKTLQLHDFTLRFPTPHYDVMSRYTRQAGLDDAWVYGLIRQESRFVQVARSSVGASGLMQLMPSTARWVAKKMGVRDFRQSAVNELDTNLAFGTYYLRHVLDQLDGHPVLATAAYNAGPGRARRWRDPQPMEGAIYAESIPFNETRDYVQKVMSNAAYYSAIIGRGLTSVKTRLGIVAGGDRGRDDDAKE
jgi:soluble lytic murein transglycosylase